LSGQDSIRGTFSHRHAVLVDLATEQRYCPLAQVAPGGARFDVYNSPLSEAAVLGFGYGYSRDYPETLVLWEAQFGDFANNAQVVMD
jgi:2-oxoglutarate dehydrogenase E1 component